MNKKLDDYIEKRDFLKTSEPKGKLVESKDSLRFVVQHHLARAAHYDFRLEWQGVLLSWAVPKGPSFDTHDKRLAVKVEDHPLDYRNFEGTIPKGQYGGGTVMLWDEGFWKPMNDVEEGLKKGELKFTLQGARLKGKWTLIKWKSKSTKDKDNWLLIKEKDEYVDRENDISNFDTSIRSGRSMEEIQEGKEIDLIQNPFKEVDVQLAELVENMPEGEEWIYEVKYDGFRIISFIEENSVKLVTRNKNDYTKQFTSIALIMKDFFVGRSMVLDGEIVVLDKSGKTDFQALQGYLNKSNKNSLTYIIFDILALDGEDLRDYSLIERKEILQSLMKNAPKELHFSNYIKKEEGSILAAACQSGLEGIVGKKTDSSYSGKRDGNWIKIKCDKRQEFVIGGYTVTDIRTHGISALLLGVYENEDLIYVGRAGTGMSHNDMKTLEKKFNSLKREKSPFKNTPKERSNEEVTWLKPEIVAEIKFATWTEDKLLRQASYKGIRIDKSPKDVNRETEKNKVDESFEDKEFVKHSDEIEGVKITSSNKVVFPSGITKGDVIDYYKEVGERMLPYVSGRVLSVVRCPKGIDESCFFMKHPTSESQHITTISIDESKGKKEDYFYINSQSGIIYEAQMGTLEFHTWGSNIKEIEKPDIMVFDLDPDEGMDLSKIRQGVKDIKSILDELSLTSYLKTSGGKGYHVVVPIRPNTTWDVFRDFAKNVAEVMEKKWPERYTTNIRKEKRKNKIFIDWLRNGRGATSVAPYSIRARKGAKVSMPILWEELDEVAPDDINMKQAILRTREEDPWKGFFDNDQGLN